MNKSLKEFILESMILESNDPTNARTDVQEIFTMIIFSMFASGHFRKINDKVTFKEIVIDKAYSYLNQEDNTNTESDKSLSILYDIIEKVNTKLKNINFKETLKIILSNKKWAYSYFFQMEIFSRLLRNKIEKNGIENYSIVQHNSCISIPLSVGSGVEICENKSLVERVSSYLDACMSNNMLVSKKKDKVLKADIYIVNENRTKAAFQSLSINSDIDSVYKEIEMWNKLVEDNVLFPISIKQIINNTQYFEINSKNKLSYKPPIGNPIKNIKFKPISDEYKYELSALENILKAIKKPENEDNEKYITDINNISDSYKDKIEELYNTITSTGEDKVFDITSEITVQTTLHSGTKKSTHDYKLSIKSNSISNDDIVKAPWRCLSPGVTAELGERGGTANMGKLIDYIKSLTRNTNSGPINQANDNFEKTFEEIFSFKPSVREHDIYKFIDANFEYFKNTLEKWREIFKDKNNSISDEVVFVIGYLVKWYRVVNRQIAIYNDLFSIARQRHPENLQLGFAETICGGVIDAWGQNPVSLPVYVFHRL